MEARPHDAPDTIPIACRLSEREHINHRRHVAEELAHGVLRVQELADGYAVCFPGEEAWANRLVTFITFERHCCPFLTMELVFEPADGPMWLRLRGAAGVKAFLATMLGPLTDDSRKV